MTADTRPLPGGGLIASEHGLLLVCGSADDVTDDLLAALWETVAAGGDGRMLVRRTAQILAGAMAGEGVDCAAAGPTGGGLAVLASGAAVVSVSAGSGEETTLDAQGALTWTDRLIPGPIDGVELRLPDAGEPDPRLRLNSGVIPGGGLRCSWTRGEDTGTSEAPPAEAAAPAAEEPPAAAVGDLPEPVARSKPAPAAEPVSSAAPEPEPEPASPVVEMPWTARPAPDRDAGTAPPGAVPPPPAAAPEQPASPAPPAAPEPAGPPTDPQPQAPQPGPAVPPPPGPPPGQYGAPAPGYQPPGPGVPGPYAPPPPGPPTPPGGPPRGTNPYSVQQSPAGPPAAAQPFESVRLGPGSGDQPGPPVPAEEADEPEPDPRPLISGVDCKNGHFNDPETPYCAVCGIAMLQRTLIAKQKPRPPLGVLLFDDGKTLRLDTDYVIGRGPESAEEVKSGQARPARLTDSDGTISRRHARVALDGWNVLLIDLGSSNGTRIEAPNGQGFPFIPPGRPVPLHPGVRVFIGSRRSFEFESHRRI